jgi:hypothetical protein
VKLVEIAEGKIMDPENLVHFGPERSPLPDVTLEGYYNRDSTKYMDLYRIPEADTVIRGTYRYKVCDLQLLLKGGVAHVYNTISTVCVQALVVAMAADARPCVHNNDHQV